MIFEVGVWDSQIWKLIAIALIDTRKNPNFGKCVNLMLD